MGGWAIGIARDSPFQKSENYQIGFILVKLNLNFSNLKT